MTPQALIQKYQAGRLTSAGLIVYLLHERRQQMVAETLELLPPDILSQLEQFVRDYGCETKIFRGPEPHPKTVRFVAEWLAKSTARVRHSI